MELQEILDNAPNGALFTDKILGKQYYYKIVNEEEHVYMSDEWMPVGVTIAKAFTVNFRSLADIESTLNSNRSIELPSSSFWLGYTIGSLVSICIMFLFK